MRFLLFDRITDLEPRTTIEGVKCIALSEDAFHHHHDRVAWYPATLVIEAMVQLLAWLPIHAHDFGVSTVLTGLEDVTLPHDLPPGTRLDIRGTLQGTNRRGSVGQVEARVAGQVVAQIGRAIYGHAPHPDPEVLRARYRQYGGTV